MKKKQKTWIPTLQELVDGLSIQIGAVRQMTDDDTCRQLLLEYIIQIERDMDLDNEERLSPISKELN